MKKWIAGYLIGSGFKVEYEENGKPKEMLFDTEREATEYFEEEETNVKKEK